VTHLGIPEFRALFETERDRLMRFLHHLTGNASDAEDLVQETFIAVWRKRDQFEGRGSAAGYLRRTAFHLFLNARQKQDRREALAPTSHEEPACTPVTDMDEREAREILVARVRSAVDDLPGRDPRGLHPVPLRGPFVRRDRGNHRHAEKDGRIAAGARRPHPE
jgi:RNA polymerase sigma factor (sigma-70 family)